MGICVTTLAELTPSQGIERALTILLESGWKASKHYANWLEYVGEEHDGDQTYSVTEYSEVWELIRDSSYVANEASDGVFTAEFVACEADGPAHDSEVYYVVLSLSDGVTTRYFKRDGWYASYDGGHLDGDVYEVHPEVRQVTVYE